MQKFLPYILLLMCLFGTGMGEVYAQENPESENEIKNQASLSYSMPDGAELEQVSNEVSVTLSENVVFDFYPDHSVKQFRGRTVEFTRLLENKGNVATTIDIKGFNIAGDDFDLQELEWTHSARSKQRVVANTDTITTSVDLGPGESFEISYQGMISEQELREELTSIMVFQAVSRETGIMIQSVDSVSIQLGAIVEIQKQQIGADENLQPGDSFTYQISGQNNGDLAALPIDVMLNGVPKKQVVLLDSIPANLIFSGFGNTDNGTPVYHLVGNDKYEFESTMPEDPDMVDVIAVLFDSLEVGESFTTEFDVRVSESATGELINVAEITYVDPDGSVTSAAASNEVVTIIDGESAVIDYFTDDDFDLETGTSSIGEPLHIQATASACNENRSMIEQVEIEITSELTSDMEKFIAIETGVNTGIFRIPQEVPTRNGEENEVVSGNEILETVEDDIITAVLDCKGLEGGSGGPRIQAEVGVDPFGVVFDSETNEEISGATVHIYDVTGENNGGNPGELATVYTANGRETASNIYTTGENGKYRFPHLKPGRYRLEVIPPSTHTPVSSLGVDQHHEDRNVHVDISYGAEFEITDQPVGMDHDIPLDPLAEGVLLAQKEVDRKIADIGDFVNYTITLRSQAVNTVRNLTVYDQLPFGFEYQPGTARLDETPIQDPQGGVGPDLAFEIGDIDPGDTRKLTYRVYLGPGSDRSDGTNTAVIQSDELIVKTSNNAQVKIEVRGGVFNDEAIIIGRVFMDCDENNMKDPSELGIPGVRLYLENGNYVVTDANGMYTMYAINPNKHVLKLDNYSLPKGSKLKVLDNRHAFDPSSRFVDVKKGEMQRADFAVCECSDEVFNEIQRRRDILTGDQTDDLTASLKQNFSIKENTSAVRGNTVQASGTIGNRKAPELTNAERTPGELITEENEALTKEILPNEDRLSIEEVIQNVEPGTDFINLVDGDTLKSDKVTLWVKGASGALFDLFLNGGLVSVERVGQRSVLQEKKLQIWEYVSVELQPGKNTFDLVEADPFGNVRGSKVVNIYTPGELSIVKVTVPVNAVSADGVSAAKVQVELLDKSGLRVGSRLPVTLDVSKGTWKVKDLDESEPGTQVFIEGGSATFELVSPIEPATSKVRAYVGSSHGEAKVEFLPDLRPMIAAGIIEGTLRLRDPLNITPAADNDGFERELKQLSYNFNSFTADGRFAFFLKGKVSGRTLLTAGFDSEKSDEERLFRDIRPEEYYPVYGESSIKGFDAQSSGRLYVRLDRGKTYALYGDFVTMSNDADIQIGGYSRAQNGLKTHFEQGRVAVDAFGVNSVSSRRIQEFAALGISRYELPDDDLIDNSEIIELITYDREQPDVIINQERLTRFIDYVIDPFSGVLTFKAPVSSVDSEFNPVFIRATYEVENDSERYLIGGVRGNLEVVDGLNIGAGIIQDNNPDNEFTLASGNLEFDLNDNTRLLAEVAQTNTEASGSGQAGRVEVLQKGEKYEVRAQIGKSSAQFDNKGASLGQAKTEARARGRLSLTQKTNLNAEFLLTRNDTTGDQTMGGLLTVQQKFSSMDAEVGLRYSDQVSSTGNVTNTNIRSKVTTKLPFISGANAFGEYEQDVNAADRKTIAVGGDYKIKSFAKAYARHEFVSSAGGRYTLQSNAQRNSTVFGLDANYMDNGKVFSEYRMSDALDGRTGQASIGLRNRFNLTEDLALNAGFERIFTVQGPNNNDGTAISTAVEYTGSSRWKGSARAEARFGVNTDTYLNSIGYGLKINQDWTFLGRNIIAVTSNEGQSGIQKLQQRLQLGAAYRDASTSQFDALFRYEFKFEKDEKVAPDYYRAAHVVSSHANYHPVNDLVFSGRIAAKYSLSQDELTRNTSFLELISGRVIYDLNDRWDTGINASLLANSDFTSKDYGLGVELGYLVATNLRLATGFNFFGYEDEDLAVNNYTQPGVYLGFSYKFDEQVFKDLAPRRMDNLIDESVYQQCLPCQVIDMKTMPIAMPEYKLEPVTLAASDIEYEPLTRFILLPRQVHFDNNRSYISPSTAQMLDKVAKFLMDQDDYIIDLHGFTDTKASHEYNKALSQRRSLAVRAYLIAAGVQASKLDMDGFGEINSRGADIVEMALERKVELNLNELNSQVTFVDQVEDIQVNQRAAKIGGWSYIFRSEHNAVPLNLNLRRGSAELNRINTYLIKRIAIALANYPEVNVRIALPNDNRFMSLQNAIMNEITANNADITRFMFDRGVAERSNEVRFTYYNTDHLVMIEQDDDIKFAGRSDVRELMESMLRVLKSREDYELIHDLSQSYVVPDRVMFEKGSTTLDNENQAIMSRIGSYLRNNEQVYLELIGEGTRRDNHRVESMREYLLSWGIDGDRLRISDMTTETNGTCIRIEYKNADSINIKNVESINGGGRR